MISALRAQVGNELELIRTHQAVAAQLGEQLRGLRLLSAAAGP